MIGDQMEVDPAILSGFAGFVQDASDTLERTDPIEPFSSARGCLRGTDFQQLCDEASGPVPRPLLMMTWRTQSDDSWVPSRESAGRFPLQ